MANTKSAEKRNRQNEQKRVANKAVRSEVRTRVKNALTVAESGDAAKSEEALREAVRKIDRAAAKGVIHKNQASNRKSRLMKRVQKSST